MKIQTFSVVAGSEACNARCKFCISKMTVLNGIDLKEPEVDWRNFRKACRLAQLNNVSTAMITGKGEPTLFPKQISLYMQHLADYQFPIIEIQTNGIPIAQQWEKYEPYLKTWYGWGLTTIAISIVHWLPEKNHEMYNPYQKEYIDLENLIVRLHDLKFSVRLVCTMVKDYIDNPASVGCLVAWAKVNKVEQLTIRPVNKPDDSAGDLSVYSWTKEHQLTADQIAAIKHYCASQGTKLMSLMHDATVYDINGQNVCLTNCLTIEPDSGDVRQLIFFPDGHLRYDWQYEGAILL